MQGPDMTNSLVGVLSRFQQKPIAFMADIEAMFYQVFVPEEQRRYLHFFDGLMVISVKNLKSMKCVSIFVVL